MAEIVRRRSWGGVLPLGRHVSISGSSLIQCASASMAPPHPGGAKCYPGEEGQGRTGPRSQSLAFFGSERDRAPFACREAHSPQFLDPRFLPCRSLRIRFDQGETMSDTVGSAGDRIRSFVERTEQLDNAIPELTASRKEVFAEAKVEVFDLMILKEIIKLQMQGKDEHETLIDV